MNRTSKGKRWSEMTTAELEAATAKYDRPFVAMDGAKPLSAKGKKLHAEAERRGRGRPRMGEGVERVLVSIEGGLLRHADAFAKANKLKRSELIVEAIRRMIGQAPPAPVKRKKAKAA